MRPVLALILLLACTLARVADDRAKALAGLDDAATERRAAAVIWFAQNGTVADDKLILPRLGVDAPMVRDLAERGMWILWSRSGDDAVDALMARGAQQLEAGDLEAAIATYSEVIRRKPAFAEGWNKRATAYFLAGDPKRSLADCDEVLKRNPYHFGALSGYGQIHFQQKQYAKAIVYWERALKVNPNLALSGNIELARKLLAKGRASSI